MGKIGNQEKSLREFQEDWNKGNIVNKPNIVARFVDGKLVETPFINEQVAREMNYYRPSRMEGYTDEEGNQTRCFMLQCIVVLRKHLANFMMML